MRLVETKSWIRKSLKKKKIMLIIMKNIMSLILVIKI